MMKWKPSTREATPEGASTVLTILLDKGDLVTRATLFSQVPIMQFQNQSIKYIYLYSVIVFLL